MKEIKMIDVVSSNVKQVGYDKETKELFVKYGASVYKYSNVEENLFEELLNAESKGRFLVENVKGSYQYTKLEQLQEGK